MSITHSLVEFDVVFHTWNVIRLKSSGWNMHNFHDYYDYDD